jgi:hypothetical protein
MTINPAVEAQVSLDYQFFMKRVLRLRLVSTPHCNERSSVQVYGRKTLTYSTIGSAHLCLRQGAGRTNDSFL